MTTIKVDVGIDPGLSGAVAFIIDRVVGVGVHLYRMPTRRRWNGKGSEIDPGGLREIMRQHLSGRDFDEVAITVEEAQIMHKKQGFRGLRSVMTIGKNYGVLLALEMVGPKPLEVHPMTWKRVMEIPKGSDKSASIALAKKLHPGVDLVFRGCRTEHDGAAEALLIAEYRRRLRAQEE